MTTTNNDTITQAIEERKQQFVELCRNSADPVPGWYFKHICEVLNHAKKIFEHDAEDMLGTDLRDDIVE